MTIRPVLASDVPEVAALVRTVLAEFGLTFGKGSATDTQVLQLPASYLDHGGGFWVAEGQSELLGCVGVFPIDDETFELRKMYLHPRARGKNIGKQLLEVAVAWTRAHGGRRLVLDTIEEMQRAIAFYEAHGFVRDDRQIRGARCTRGYVRELER